MTWRAEGERILGEAERERAYVAAAKRK